MFVAHVSYAQCSHFVAGALRAYKLFEDAQKAYLETGNDDDKLEMNAARIAYQSAQETVTEMNKRLRFARYLA